MPLANPITDIQQLKDHPALAALLAANAKAVVEAKFDRDELSIYVAREFIIAAATTIQKAGFNFLSDITCVDWYPSEPRFEVIYHIVSHRLKEYVRLKVRLAEDDPVIDSIISVWPSCNFFEREIYDLFGVRFIGREPMSRIMMPEEWEGHPLRKDYPVEGYR
jgi:NADH-quinone oxidoreductase subunit C